MRWDVVVVGAGKAGMPAAIAAAERGARVLEFNGFSSSVMVPR
jgi:succinate dehydrogenase/fumarate reductase flavoprotein subunit